MRAFYSGASGPLHLLEIGAGDGAFLKRLRSSSLGPLFDATAMDYDAGAVERLRRAGFATRRGSVAELAHERPNTFSVVCLFQTLEHISDVHDLFESLSRLLTINGHIFISVPNGPAIDQQEDLTGLWDMPPNHVVRWTRTGLEVLGRAHGFRLAEWALEHPHRLRTALQLARYRILAHAYDDRSFAAWINAWRVRWARGPLKLALAITLAAPILKSWQRLLPPTQWAHFRLAVCGPDSRSTSVRASNGPRGRTNS
jgi:SAM-dependent methyltransferase